MSLVALVVAAISAIVVLGVKTRRRDSKRKVLVESLLATRVELDPQKFAERFYAGGAVSVARRVRIALDRIGRSIAVDMSGALPTDDLEADLGLDALDSMARVELILDLEREFDIKIPDREATRLRTVGDLVDYIALAVASPGVSTT